MVTGTCFTFPSIGNGIIPTDELTFFRGVETSTTNQVLVLYRAYKPSKTYGIFLSHHKLGAAVLLGELTQKAWEYNVGIDSGDVLHSC